MSIIIKGMDMPNNGQIELIIRPHGKVHSKTRGIYAEAIEIPTPHGRLIDGDKLKEKRETMCWREPNYTPHESDFVDTRHIDNAPTILEAEE